MNSILQIKSRFFAIRLALYFSFLLIPVWIQKTLTLNRTSQLIIIVLYMLFMLGQWYLMGKEIDHRLKIYFRANSSIDRVLSRILLGNIAFIVLFNLLSFVPWEHIRHFYWGVWVVFGLYYSWPTRGKIIKESMSSQFVEYRYLDFVEKVLLFLSALLVIVSIPNFPKFENISTLQLMFDPKEHTNQLIWTFLKINYFPFWKNPSLYALAWSIHFYFWGIVLFCLATYSMMRLFFSRRLSILGVFSILSTWSMSKILEVEYMSTLQSTFSVLWMWAMIWSVKSATYRSGLLLGFICFLGALISSANILLFPITMILLHFFQSDKTSWYRKQTLKYMLVGLGFTLMSYIFGQGGEAVEIFRNPYSILLEVLGVINQKSFYVISLVGVAVSYFYVKLSGKGPFSGLQISLEDLKKISILIIVSLLFSITLQPGFMQGFSLIWLVAFFTLIPLELIFQSINKLRSQRNLIFFIYILICLLDSHIEGRVKLLLKFLS